MKMERMFQKIKAGSKYGIYTGDFTQERTEKQTYRFNN
jgi:hypothetical protein